MPRVVMSPEQAAWADASDPVADAFELFSPQDLVGVERGARAKPRTTPPETTEPPPDPALFERDRLTGGWWGARQALDDRGLTFNATYFLELSAVASGGVDRAVSLRSFVEANARFDLARLVSIPGAVVYADLRQKTGPNVTDDVGSIQTISNIDAPNFLALYELWWEQTLFDGLLRLKVGKVDMNNEFAFAEHASGFLHGNFGAKTTLLLAPSYPDPSTSVNLFIYPAEWLYLGAGVYDGSAALGLRTGPRGPESFVDNNGNWFIVGEAGVTWDRKHAALPGRLALGGWGHTADLTRYDGVTQPGAAAPYLMADQTLWLINPDAPDDPRGLSAFLMLGWADQAVSPVRSHLGAGLAAVGLIPARERDTLGVAVSWDRLSRDPNAGFTRDAETVFEAYYGVHITPAVILKGDVQYIIDPGGGAATDALVFTMRIELSF